MSQSALVAIVVPEEEILVRWAKSHGKGDKSFRDLCNDPEVNAMILQDMREVGKAAKVCAAAVLVLCWHSFIRNPGAMACYIDISYSCTALNSLRRSTCTPSCSALRMIC